jgi:hypothetical protein
VVAFAEVESLDAVASDRGIDLLTCDVDDASAITEPIVTRLTAPGSWLRVVSSMVAPL